MYAHGSNEMRCRQKNEAAAMSLAKLADNMTRLRAPARAPARASAPTERHQRPAAPPPAPPLATPPFSRPVLLAGVTITVGPPLPHPLVAGPPVPGPFRAMYPLRFPILG
eukprot:TRINITY_DN14820_c0_g1_i1.p3 TRINITY_DN14820_c0_g1~~TRINITY_DN14820_c0_g1_i1.p3  ORF type:complete len:110 (+),score=18.27 TRINITY_DN14820_c0_g1_i1:98-427(+)